ncbi:ALQxL family class IV lanthipeptide [Streptomyces sp. NPDC056194]
MQLDLDALQQLPAEEEQASMCQFSCSASCPYTCLATGN